MEGLRALLAGPYRENRRGVVGCWTCAPASSLGGDDGQGGGTKRSSEDMIPRDSSAAHSVGHDSQPTGMRHESTGRGIKGGCRSPASPAREQPRRHGITVLALRCGAIGDGMSWRGYCSGAPASTHSMIFWMSAGSIATEGGMTTPSGCVPMSDWTRRLLSGSPGMMVGPLLPVVSAS